MIKDFKDIDMLSPADFEIFVRDLFEVSGWSDSVITQVGKEYMHGDGGVDIFAYRAGRKFAIEVKQRNIQTNVDIKALNQLVTGAKLAKVTYMILVTNSYFTSEVKIRALRLGVELIDRDELQNLWVKRHSEIGRDIKPRTYQISVINEAINQFEQGKNKILIEMATGLGKTYTVALLIKELIGRSSSRPRVLFLAHQIEILLQSVTAFKNVLGIGSYSFSACFSGSEPEDTDFVFASFDTLYSQLESLKASAFDFIIVDEAHHTPAKTYSEVVTKFLPKLLIGLTATPYRTDNKSVAAFFGGSDGHIGKYDLIWGLKSKRLAFPKYLVLLDDLNQEKISQLDSGLSISDLDKRLFLHKKDEEVVNIIEKTVENKDIENVKGIVFCRSIKHMRHLLGFFKLGTATSVHSKMNDQQRRENIRNFREGGYKYILVCDLFNEGIDIPETNLLVFMRYTGSRTIWLQQLGRGLRKTPNKEYVHILDFAGSLDRLNEIKELSQAVRNKKLNREDLEERDVENLSDEVFHDGTLEVSYSESAAKVLELIETLKYRLNSREVLIDKIRSYYERVDQIPNLCELEKNLPDVTLDQISTHFGSYFGYLKAAFNEELDQSKTTEKILDYYHEYSSNYRAVPSNKAISLNFSFGSLLEFTEIEISNLLGKIEKSSHKANPLVESCAGEESDSDLSCLGSKSLLIKKYQGRILKRLDFKSLQSEEQHEITNEFGSLSMFLKKLNDSRK